MKKSGIYIHIPFCVKRCGYCDFYSEVIKDRGKMKNYGKKVISELIERFHELKGSEIVSIYVGGGTPSVMDEEFFSDLLSCVSELGCNIKKMEITVEVNPADISDKWLKSLKNSGVNRISAGVQSFDD
ncbi:MAG TPA: radical SAM protein, partial [bacterium]|nr:radical SAM protein [bacterium]